MQKQKIKLETAQNVQDKIIRKMSPDEKIKTASALTAFCLKLNRINDKNNKPNAIFK